MTDPALVFSFLLGGTFLLAAFLVFRTLQRRLVTLESELLGNRRALTDPPTAEREWPPPNPSPSPKTEPKGAPAPEEEDTFGTALAVTREEYRHRIQALRSREISLREQSRDLERERENLTAQLAEIAGMDPETARDRLLEKVAERFDKRSIHLPHYLSERTGIAVEEEARRTLLAVMQRISVQAMADHTLTQVAIPNEEMKGRLIGREGRNIRSFESETGTTLMIDETPGLVLISAFDPVRREVARQALENLVRDGRIHPAIIEEAVQAARVDVEKLTYSLGEEAISRLKLHSVHPEIVAILGRLHFRQSNGQNTLSHSIEVARFSSLLAAEIDLDPTLAKRAGLFHDLGKAMNEEFEGSHAGAAASLLRRYGEPPEVVNAVAASHDEVPAESPYAGVLMLADTVSAARPGARTDSSKGFLQRVRSLEELARSFKGVSECYALQAGREIRVILDPEAMSDNDAARLAVRLRQRIEEELTYPGNIRITVVRESRFTEEAT